MNASQATGVRPYQADLLNVVKVNHSSVELNVLLDPDAAKYLIEPERIIKGCAELDDPAFEGQLYTDPKLRHYKPLLELALLLHDQGLLVFRVTRSTPKLKMDPWRIKMDPLATLEAQLENREGC